MREGCDECCFWDLDSVWVVLESSRVYGCWPHLAFFSFCKSFQLYARGGAMLDNTDEGAREDSASSILPNWEGI